MYWINDWCFGKWSSTRWEVSMGQITRCQLDTREDKNERLKEVFRLLLSMTWPICKIHRIRTDTHQMYPIYDCFPLKLHVDGDCVEVQIGTFTN